MYQRKRSVLCWDEASDLSHNTHQSNRSDVSAFAAHVTASNDLESCLLTSVDIVWDKFLWMNLDRVKC